MPSLSLSCVPAIAVTDDIGKEAVLCGRFDRMELEEKKQGAGSDLLWGILSYLGILVLIPLLKKKKSAFVAYHVNQGLVLFVLEFCAGMVVSLIGLILMFAAPALFIVVNIIYGIIGILFLICHIIGLIHVVRHEEKKVPVFGEIKVYRPAEEKDED